MKKKVLIISPAALLFLLALGLTLYPLIANRYNQRHQSEIHTAYQEQVAQADKAEIIAAEHSGGTGTAGSCSGRGAGCCGTARTHAAGKGRTGGFHLTGDLCAPRDDSHGRGSGPSLRCAYGVLPAGHPHSSVR